jgi:hypothetical protein
MFPPSQLIKMIDATVFQLATFIILEATRTLRLFTKNNENMFHEGNAFKWCVEVDVWVEVITHKQLVRITIFPLEFSKHCNFF